MMPLTNKKLKGKNLKFQDSKYEYWTQNDLVSDINNNLELYNL